MTDLFWSSVENPIPEHSLYFDKTKSFLKNLHSQGFVAILFNLGLSFQNKQNKKQKQKTLFPRNTENNSILLVTSPKTVSAVGVDNSLAKNLKEITKLLIISRVLPFLECHINEIMYYEAFSG